MSKLYLSATSDARKSEVTARGHRYVDAHVRGYSAGIQVVASLDDDGTERFAIWFTGGTDAPKERALVYSVTRAELTDIIAHHNRQEGRA